LATLEEVPKRIARSTGFDWIIKILLIATYQGSDYDHQQAAQAV